MNTLTKTPINSMIDLKRVKQATAHFKSCRIVQNCYQDWCLHWYEKDEQEVLHFNTIYGSSKEELIEVAKQQHLTHYFDQHSNNLIQLLN